MNHETGYLNRIKNEKIYYQSWLPDDKNKAQANIILVHGLGSHSGWYNELAHKLVAHNYNAYALDLYGHGRSSGQRGHINSWADYRQNVDYFVDWVRSQYVDKPIFILGHSLGGLITLDYVLRFSPSIAGLGVMAPALGKVTVSPVKVLIGKLLSWIYPRFSLNVGISDSASSHYSEIVKAYKTDPLRHRRVTARFGTEYFKTTKWMEENLDRLNSPILILQGDEDSVTPPECTQELFNQLPDIDKQYKIYEGAYHDLHHDTCETIVIEDIIHWFDQKCPLKTRIYQNK